MNGRDYEELLSAYHDGEVAGEERASIEQLLRDDSPARETLEEITDVSRLIRELPRPVAPADLHAAVMQQVRQAAPTRVAPPPAARPVAGSRSRRYWVWSAATVATLTVVVFAYQYRPFGLPESGVAYTESPAVRESDVAPAAPRSADLAQNYVPPSGADVVADGVSPPMPALPMSAPPETATRDDSADVRALGAAVDGGQLPQIGDVLKNIVRHDDQVYIVQYTVVDVVRAFGQAQFLLEQNGIETISGNQQVAPSGASASEKFYAIFVEAPDDKLDSSLAALRGEEFVHEVSVSQLDEVRQFPIPPDRRQRATEESGGGLESLPHRKVERRDAPPPEPAAPAAADAVAARAAASREENGIAVPIPVPISPSVMRDVLDAGASQSRGGAPGQTRPTFGQRPPAEDRATTGGQPDKQVPVPRKRILIVLVPERPQP